MNVMIMRPKLIRNNEEGFITVKRVHVSDANIDTLLEHVKRSYEPEQVIVWIQGELIPKNAVAILRLLNLMEILNGGTFTDPDNQGTDMEA